MTKNIYIGVDLGGTNIKLGLCDESGSLLQTHEGPTGVEDGASAVLDRIAAYAEFLVSTSPYNWDQVVGIGIGIAGFIDVKHGVVKRAVNLNWDDVPAKAELEKRLNKPVRLDNDANVAALGEAWSGAGKGVKYVVCYTLGTGVGGGIINDGHILQGFRGMAGELGHMCVVPDLEAIQCNCGQHGCLETVSSATGIVRMAENAVNRGESTSLALIQPITAKDVFDAAKSGDESAIRIIERAAYYLGRSMAAITVICNPQRFIIGGGVSRAGDILFEPIRETFKKYSVETISEGVDIVPAMLGNDAGIVGAAGLLLHGN